METTLMLSSILCLLALLANPLLVAPEAVLDSDGDELVAGGRYHIVPAILSALGGGVTLGKNRNGRTCPLDVVQERFDRNDGLPLAFFPMDPKQEVIQLHTDLNIQFSISPVWKLSNKFVTTGGVIGNSSSCETFYNWFRIEKLTPNESPPTYKLVFCPKICSSVKCADIGIIFHNGARHLAISDFPFWVIFMKAGLFSHNSIIMNANN